MEVLDLVQLLIKFIEGVASGDKLYLLGSAFGVSIYVEQAFRLLLDTVEEA